MCNCKKSWGGHFGVRKPKDKSKDNAQEDTEKK